MFHSTQMTLLILRANSHESYFLERKHLTLKYVPSKKVVSAKVRLKKCEDT